MILKVYLDSSVLGGLFDDEFKESTKKLFQEFEKGLYQPVISNLTEEKISKAPKEIIFEFNKLKRKSVFLILNKEAINLAEEYRNAGNLPNRMNMDTLHIALASINKIDILVSWNFRDIVNLRRILVYNSVNIKFGLKEIEIRSPKEILHVE